MWEQSWAEVRRQQELVELHLRKISGTQNGIGVVDHQLAIEPAAHAPVGVRLVRFQVERVELNRQAPQPAFPGAPLSQEKPASLSSIEQIAALVVEDLVVACCS